MSKLSVWPSCISALHVFQALSAAHRSVLARVGLHYREINLRDATSITKSTNIHKNVGFIQN